MRCKRALLHSPLICIGTKKMFQLGMSITKWVLVQLHKKDRPGHASDINLQDPQPAHPGANRPSLCCNWGMFVHVFFYCWALPTKSQPYLLVKLSWGHLDCLTITVTIVTYEVQGGIQRGDSTAACGFFPANGGCVFR